MMSKDKKSEEKKSNFVFYTILFALTAVCVLIYFYSEHIGYADYNPLCAYSILDPKQWLGWFVSIIGGLHTYDLVLPFALVAGYLYKRLSPRDVIIDNRPHRRNTKESSKSESNEKALVKGRVGIWATKLFGKNSEGAITLLILLAATFIFTILYWSNSFALTISIVMAIFFVVLDFEKLKDICTGTTHDSTFGFFDGAAVFLLVFLTLRVVYFPLFAINYYTAGEPKSIEMAVTGTGYVSNKNSKTYYLFVDISNGMPYKLKVSKSTYNTYKSGKASKVLAYVCKGLIGFDFVTDFKIEKTDYEVQTVEGTVDLEQYVGTWMDTSDNTFHELWELKDDKTFVWTLVNHDDNGLLMMVKGKYEIVRCKDNTYSFVTTYDLNSLSGSNKSFIDGYSKIIKLNNEKVEEAKKKHMIHGKPGMRVNSKRDTMFFNKGYWTKTDIDTASDNKGLGHRFNMSEVKYIQYGNPQKATQLRVSITSVFQDISELQRAASIALFDIDCPDIQEAYEKFISKYKMTSDIVDYPYLEISFSVVSSRPIPLLRAEMTYSKEKGSYEFMCEKDFAVDVLHKKLLTIDNVLVKSQAKEFKQKAKGANISLRVEKNDRIVFYWFDGNEEVTHVITYDGSQKFTKDFRELMESVKK